MQRCKASVRLGGDVRQVVNKVGLSPAEVLVLRHIHGEDAVTSFEPNGNDKGRSVDERQRLLDEYGRDHVLAVFPGPTAPMPEKFADIGIDLLEGDNDPNELKQHGGKRKGATAGGATSVGADDLKG